MSTPSHPWADPPATPSARGRPDQPANQMLTVLDSMQSYGESFMKEVNKLREQVLQTERQENEAKRLNQKLATANKELYTARKDAAAAQAMSEARLQQTIKLQKERDEALAEAKKMRRACEKAETNNLRADVRDLERKCEALRTERCSLVAERDDLKVKADTCQKLIEELTKLLQAAAAQQEAAREREEKHAATQRSLEDARQTHVELQHKLSLQETSYDAQIKQLRSDLDAANAELRQAERFRQKLDTLPKRKEALKVAVLIHQRKDLLRKRVCFNCGTRDGPPPSSASSEPLEIGRQLARQALSSSSYYHASPFGALSSDDASTSSFAPGDSKSPQSDAGYCAESPEGEDRSGACEGDAGPEETDIISEPSPSLSCIASTSASSGCASMLSRSRKRKLEEPRPDNYE